MVGELEPAAGLRADHAGIYDQSLARTSFTLVMLAIAGSMALVLGIIGIYGVISYAVSQRRREIGIRLALGAQPGELKRMFVRHGLILAGIGVAIGLGAAAGLTRLMTSLLFGIKPLDPLTYAAGRSSWESPRCSPAIFRPAGPPPSIPSKPSRPSNQFSGSANTTILLALLGFRSGARRLSPELTSELPVLTATYCLPRTL